MLGKENAAVMDPNIFTDDNEWRKSAHFGLHKRRVCFKETKNSKQFNLDVWKRFVVGEELIVRANFGFSAEVKFHGMKKQQSCQYDDVPLMKDLSTVSRHKGAASSTDADAMKPKGKDPTTSFARRVGGASLGKAQLVTDPEMVNHQEGRFLKGQPGSLGGSYVKSGSPPHLLPRDS